MFQLLLNHHSECKFCVFNKDTKYHDCLCIVSLEVLCLLTFVMSMKIRSYLQLYAQNQEIENSFSCGCLFIGHPDEEQKLWCDAWHITVSRGLKSEFSHIGLEFKIFIRFKKKMAITVSGDAPSALIIIFIILKEPLNFTVICVSIICTHLDFFETFHITCLLILKWFGSDI